MLEKIRHLHSWAKRCTAVLTTDTVRCMQGFQLLRVLAPLVTGVVLTKLIASRAALGMYESVVFALTLCTFFWVSALLRGVLVLAGRQGVEQGVLLGSLFRLLSSVGVVVGGLLLLFRRFFEEGVLGTSLHTEYYVLCGLVVVSAPTFINEYIYFIEGKGRQLLLYGIVLLVGQVGVICMPILLGYGLEVSLYGLLVFQVLKLIWAFGLLGQSIFLFSRVVALSLWGLSAPLMLSFLMATGADYIDGILILQFRSAADFVLFRYSARELPISIAFCTALSSAMLLPLSRELASGMTELRQRSLRLMHLLFPLSVGLVLFSKWIFPVIYNSDYQAGAFIFNIFSLLVISRVVFPQTVLTALNSTKVQFWITLFELLLNAIVSLVLLHYIGLEGVAWGTFVAFSVEKILLVGYLWYAYDIIPNQYIPVRWYLFYVSVLLVCFAFVQLYFR
jgi:O-antigen/teichoic acid export membrane protein